MSKEFSYTTLFNFIIHNNAGKTEAHQATSLRPGAEKKTTIITTPVIRDGSSVEVEVPVSSELLSSYYQAKAAVGIPIKPFDLTPDGCKNLGRYKEYKAQMFEHQAAARGIFAYPKAPIDGTDLNWTPFD